MIFIRNRYSHLAIDVNNVAPTSSLHHQDQYCHCPITPESRETPMINDLGSAIEALTKPSARSHGPSTFAIHHAQDTPILSPSQNTDSS